MPPSVEKLGRVSTQSVLKCTGKSWDQWIAILDKAGCRTAIHGEITSLLKKKYKLSLWWQQGVAIGYEIHIGKRIDGRTQKGDYSTAASKTFPLDKKAAWRFLTSEKGISIWLNPLSKFELKAGNTFEVYGEIFGEVRTMKIGERARLSWKEIEWKKPSILNIIIVPRKGEKSVVVFQHDNLKDSQLRLKMRTHWKKVLIELVASCSLKSDK